VARTKLGRRARRVLAIIRRQLLEFQRERPESASGAGSSK
jgi:hypothetical protein